ncbi:MAG: MarR family transcriptional regulator [Desulfobacteraceae bacterium]|jgi:DNA-binding MarR family transcriptional regulator
MNYENYSKAIKGTFEECSEESRELITEGLTLMDLHREIEMFAEIIGSRFDIPLKQMEILEILISHIEKNLTPAELADEVHLTRSTMTGNLDALQGKGLITRESHPSDRRMTLIKITDKGIEFCKRAMPKRYSDIFKVMSALTSDERNHMKEVYKKLLNIIKEIAMEGIN